MTDHFFLSFYRPGHYGRALEDAIASHKNQWPPSWEEKNPLSGGAGFNSMTPSERVRVKSLKNLEVTDRNDSLRCYEP